MLSGAGKPKPADVDPLSPMLPRKHGQVLKHHELVVGMPVSVSFWVPGSLRYKRADTWYPPRDGVVVSLKPLLFKGADSLYTLAIHSPDIVAFRVPDERKQTRPAVIADRRKRSRKRS